MPDSGACINLRIYPIVRICQLEPSESPSESSVLRSPIWQAVLLNDAALVLWGRANCDASRNCKCCNLPVARHHRSAWFAHCVNPQATDKLLPEGLFPERRVPFSDWAFRPPSTVTAHSRKCSANPVTAFSVTVHSGGMIVAIEFGTLVAFLPNDTLSSRQFWRVSRPAPDSERHDMMTPGSDYAGGTTLCMEFDMDSRGAVLGNPDDEFFETFDDCAAAFIVEKCRLQPAHQWQLRTTGEIVLQALEALGCVDGSAPCPVSVSNLVIRTHGIIREIVPESRRVRF